jgi:hypothetical protein
LGYREHSDKDEDAIIHLHMGMSQRNTWYRYLKQKCQLFYKNGEQEGKTCPDWRVGTVGVERI